MWALLLLLVTAAVGAAADVQLAMPCPSTHSGWPVPVGKGEVTLGMVVSDIIPYSPGVNLAVQWINSRSDVLPDHVLQIRCLEGVNLDDSVVSSMQHLHYFGNSSGDIDVLLGPSAPRSLEVVADMSKELGMPTVSMTFIDDVFSNDVNYPHVSRTLTPAFKLGYAARSLLDAFGWTRFATLSSLEDIPQSLVSGLHSAVSEDSTFEVVSSLTFPADVQDTSAIRSQLRTIKDTNVRVIFLMAYSHEVIQVLDTARELDMLGKPYVWVFSYSSSRRAELYARFVRTPRVLDSLDGALGLLQNLGTGPAQRFPGRERMAALWERTMAANETTLCQDLLGDGFNASLVEHTSCLDGRNGSSLLKPKIGSPSMHSTARNAFDTITLIAYALHERVELDKACSQSSTASPDCSLLSTSPREMLTRLLRRVEFDGATGRMKLDGDTGDRITDEFVVVSFRNQTTQRRSIMVLPDEVASIRNGSLSFLDGQQMNWHTGFESGVVPRDRPLEQTLIRTISTRWFAAAIVLVAIGCTFAIGILAFNLYHSGKLVIRMSSVSVNCVIVFGCILALLTVVVYGFDGEDLSQGVLDSVCMLRGMLLSLSFSLSFGGLFAKTFRVARIFNSRQLIVQVTDLQILSIVVAQVLLDAILWSAWWLTEPMTSKLQFVSSDYIQDTDTITHWHVRECHSDHLWTWTTVVLAYKGLTTIVGVILAVEVRHVEIPALNDSKFIGFSIYHMTLLSSFILTWTIAETADVDMLFGVMALGMFVMVMGVLTILFVPKIVAVARGRDHLLTSHRVSTQVRQSDLSKGVTASKSRHSGGSSGVSMELARRRRQSCSSSDGTQHSSLRFSDSDSHSHPPARVHAHSGSEHVSISARNNDGNDEAESPEQ